MIFSSAIYYLVLLRLLPLWSKLADEPLEAMIEINLLGVFIQIILTAHGCRLLENLCHLWIHLDSKIFLYHDLLMSFFYLFLHPVREGFLENSCAHITEPLFRCLGELEVRLRQILVHLRVLFIEELADLLHTKSVILRNVNCPDEAGAKRLLLSTHQLLEKVN